MLEHTEARRQEAKQYRGVWYDTRADKFVAEVYSRGDRHFLGHFDTAEAAGAAYNAARAELPSGRADGVETFATAFEAFLDTAATDASGKLETDQSFYYRGQEFMFTGIAFRKMNRKSRPFYVWNSFCSVCEALYETMTTTRPTGITRTCERHRAGGGRKTAAPSPQQSGGVVDPAWPKIAQSVAEALALVADTFSSETFLAECRKLQPDLPRAFNRFALTHAASPVETCEGGLRLRD